MSAAEEKTLSLRELYTRAHWIIVADFQKNIHDNEKLLKEPLPEERLQMIYSMTAELNAQMRLKIKDYQDEYDCAMRTSNTKMMKRFIGNVRSTYGDQPEFAFIPDVIPDL